MKKLILFLLLLTCVYANNFKKVDTRFVGIVTDVKIINIDDQENVIFWVRADKDYLIQGRAQIPYIYVGDSLYEYWVNYKKVGIGTSSNEIIYQIINP